MHVLSRTIHHPSRTDTIRIYPLGDLHLGAAGCCEKLLAATVEAIRLDPFAYWIGLGDYCDFINLSDPRFAAGALAPWIKITDLQDLAAVQRDRFLDLVTPIADKCLALVKGNHEDTIHRHYERAIYAEIVAGVKALMSDPPAKLGLDYCGFLRLRLERGASETAKGHVWALDVFCHHGWGGGRLAGSKALKLERAAARFLADIALIGHWHTQMSLVVRQLALNRRGTRLIHRTCRTVATGHWLDGHAQDATSYAEKAGYPPAEPGCPVVSLCPGTQTIRVTT